MGLRFRQGPGVDGLIGGIFPGQRPREHLASSGQTASTGVGDPCRTKPAKVQDPACRALLGSNNVLRLLDADNIGFSYECEVCREACHCCAPLLVQGEGGVKVKSWPTGGRVLELSSLSFRYRAKVAARSSATTYGTESTRAKA